MTDQTTKTDSAARGGLARRSRRQLLAGGSGGLAAGGDRRGLARAAPAAAANGDPVMLGQANKSASLTSITNSTADRTVLTCFASGSGNAVLGTTISGTCVLGASGSDDGVFGVSAGGNGVAGSCPKGTDVRGDRRPCREQGPTCDHSTCMASASRRLGARRPTPRTLPAVAPQRGEPAGTG